jgi:hypothetical protein
VYGDEILKLLARWLELIASYVLETQLATATEFSFTSKAAWRQAQPLY